MEENMYRHSTLIATTAALLLVALQTPQAGAEEKQHVSFKAPAENSKYTQQVNVTVGDVPNHIVRIYEVHITFPNNPPVINGIKLVEQFSRGTADYIDGNGSGTQYSIFVLENGDRFFSRNANLVQNIGGKGTTSTQVGHITGGTGKVAGIHGTVRLDTNFNMQTGFNESQTDIDYSIGKWDF
jgi:ketosteroid isomerase-like protein